MKKDGFATIIVIVLVIVVIAAVGFWYYTSQHNGIISTSSQGESASSTTSIAGVTADLQGKIATLGYNTTNATLGDLVWIDQDGTPIDVHASSSLTFAAATISVSSAPTTTSLSPQIAYNFNTALIKTVDGYMGLHGFVLQTNQSTGNSDYSAVGGFVFSNAYYSSQSGLRCRIQVWINAGPEGLDLETPYLGSLTCIDQISYQTAYNNEAPFIKGLGAQYASTTLAVKDYQLCPSDTSKATVRFEYINGDGEFTSAMENTPQGWVNMHLAPAQMDSGGCF